MKVATYIRVSSEEQALHGISLDAQEKTLREWCKTNGHTIVGEYRDEGISGKKPPEKRPALQSLLRDMSYGHIQMVVFTKLDRWFRSVKEYYKVQEVLDKYKVCWRTVLEDYETETASGRFKVNIMLSVAEDEADRTGERIKTIVEHKKTKKEATNNSCPLGYKIVNKKFVIDEEIEEYVRGFFKIYRNTHSVTKARDYLLENGIHRTYNSCDRILHNREYVGEFYGIKDYAPAYFTEEEWQDILSVRGKIVRKVEENRTYLFAGIIYCGDCGGKCSGGTRIPHGKQVYTTYHCKRRSLNHSCINSHYIHEYKIEEYLLSSVDEKLKKLKAEVKPKNVDHKKDIARLEDKKKKLTDLYLNGILPIEEVKKRNDEYDAELIGYKKDSLQFDIKAIEELLSVGWVDMYRQLEKCDKAQFWRLLLDRIVLYEDGRIEYFFGHSYSNCL